MSKMQHNVNVLSGVQLVFIIGLLDRVFTNGPGDRVQSQVKSYQRLKK